VLLKSHKDNQGNLHKFLVFSHDGGDFEKAVKEDGEIPNELKITENMAKVITQVAEERTKIKKSNGQGYTDNSLHETHRHKSYQDAFTMPNTAKNERDQAEIGEIASPRYSVKVSARSWKPAEDLLEQITQK
jgi:translation initiation factor 2 alpha subunit (eIF-2alpha)